MAALTEWPRSGLPSRPETWILTVARRRWIDSIRRDKVRVAALPFLIQATEVESSAMLDDPFPDERLKLLFVCAHPGIDPAIHTPLMLQTVFGLDAARIATLFLVDPAAMSQRLVRAKAKIRVARIAFKVPDPGEAGGRLDAVLAAVYGAYTANQLLGVVGNFGEESAWLARSLCDLLPGEPEALGLLALIDFAESRRASSRIAGRFVPLDEQDASHWDSHRIRRAERLLKQAAAFGNPGRIQIEAAIQSVHAQRAYAGRTDWDAIVRLHDHLLRLAPTIGAFVSRAAAVAEAEGPAAAWSALGEIPVQRVESYQPYWATRAAILSRLNRSNEARAAYERACNLCADPMVRDFLILCRDRLDCPTMALS